MALSEKAIGTRVTALRKAAATLFRRKAFLEDLRQKRETNSFDEAEISALDTAVEVLSAEVIKTRDKNRPRELSFKD